MAVIYVHCRKFCTASSFTFHEYLGVIGLLHYLIMWLAFCKQENSSLLKNFVSWNWKSILKLGLTCEFSAVYLKRCDHSDHQKLEGFVWEKQLLPPSHAWVVFHTNPCKLWKFQTGIKYFVKHYGAQITLLFITGNLSPQMHKGKI